MTITLNKYLFITICDKNYDLYEEIISNFNNDYLNTIKKLKETTDCIEVRKLIHNFIGIIMNLKINNSELLYILKSILNVPKTNLDYDLYRDYIYMLIVFDKKLIGL